MIVKAKTKRVQTHDTAASSRHTGVMNRRDAYYSQAAARAHKCRFHPRGSEARRKGGGGVTLGDKGGVKGGGKGGGLGPCPLLWFEV